MKPTFTLFRKLKSRLGFYVLTLLLLSAIPEAKADLSFKDYHVKFIGMSSDTKGAYIDFHILCQDWDGTNDELDDIKMYYLDPNTKQWVYFFHGDFDNSDRWDCHWKDDNLVYHNSSSNGNWHNGDRYGQILFYPPTGVFIENIIFKAEVDWDIDSNDNNTGTDHVFYYNYVNSKIPSKSWEDFSSYQYIRSSNNEITFDFLIADLYGDGVVGSDKQWRHELDDIRVQYKDASGNWNTILHGDCDNSRYDSEFQVFEKMSDVSATTRSVGNRHYATVKWDIPASEIGRQIEFRYAYQWDEWADVVNKDAIVNENFTVLTYTDEFVAQDAQLIPSLCDLTPKLTYSWTLENARSVDEFRVRRRTVGVSGDITIATITDFDPEATSFEFINAADASIDQTVDNSYLLEDGKQYTYWVYTKYKDDNSINSNWSIGHKESEEISLIPSANPFDVNSSELNGQPVVVVEWGQLCRTEGLSLYKKIGNGNFEEVSLTQTNKNNRKYVDASVAGCVNYTYKLELISAELNSQIYTQSLEGEILLNTDLANALVNLDVSKGYYDERVVLKWDNNGGDGMDRIKVTRKQLGNEEEVIIAVLDATDNMYIDETALSGIYYEYNVYGEGKCGDSDLLSQSSILSSIGFCQRMGIVSGQISYDGGTAVEGVRVALERGGNTSLTSGYAIKSGEGKSISISEAGFTDDFGDGFSVEAWFKLYDNNGVNEYFSCAQSGDKGFSLYQSGDSINILTLEMGGTTNSFSILDSVYNSISSTHQGFNHYALNYIAGEVTIYCNSIEVFSKIISYNNTTDGVLTVAQDYDGVIDELRVWSASRSQEEIYDDFTRLLSGTEDNLELYWRFDEGVGSEVYDMTNHRGTFNKNHGELMNSAWSNDIPPADYLALVGLTNADGYYIIDGIRYAGTGETFKVTPMLGVHEFQPLNRTMFIGNSSLTQNDKNFDDVSSFKVKGKICYENTNYPVKDVFIKVDGMYVQGEGGLPVMTDEKGDYEVDVPIGEHYIQVEKQGHTFVTAHFPLKDENGNVVNYTFDAPKDMINFYDNTKIKVIGKIVGGAVEAAKQTASVEYPATNNIGKVKVTLTSIGRQYYLPNGKFDTTFYTNETDGNFEIELLPEIYKPVESDAIISEGTLDGFRYSFNSDADITPMDLRSSFNDRYVLDSIFVTDTEGYKQFDRIDTACVYNFERNWVYRTEPQLKVTNLEDGYVFGNKTLPYVNESGESDNVEIARDSTEGYAQYDLKHPVFSMGNYYGYRISAYESYINMDSEIEEQVPVTDGTVAILNNCAASEKELEVGFDEEGKVDYVFAVGMPNLASPFTLSTDIKLIIGSKSYQWDQAPLECYVFGAVPTGSNFVTKGPDDIDFILRDPAGSNSYAFIEKGTTFSMNSTTSASISNTTSATASLLLGAKIKTNVGTPFFEVGTEIEMENTNTVTAETTATASGELSMNYSTTLNKSYSTSESADYVGAMGDLFFGRSSNIIYGLANSVELMKRDEVLDASTIVSSLDIDGQEYVVAQKKALRFSPEVKTTFVYSQNHIEESLIPNLKLLRNLYYTSHTESYNLIFTDSVADEYLTNNDDVRAWGSDAKDTDGRFNGPSYEFTPPLDDDGNKMWDADTVRYYNKQIKMWEGHLANNEKQKIEAEPYQLDIPSNISFDAGASYESSIVTSKELAMTMTFELEISATVASEVGAKVNNNGLSVGLSNTTTSSFSQSLGMSVSHENTVGFALADEDAGDYFSIDVLKCKAGNGPVFRTRGGQSSCPYEGATETKYYNPGTIISEATMQIEQPHIRVDENLVMGVPEDAAAYFTIELSNTSETGDDGWYNLIIDSETNPYGAKVSLDGAAMGANGKQILIPAGQTVYKTIAVTKGRSDIDEYDDIKLILHSQCQYDPTNFLEDIYDEVTISTHFVPACSPIQLMSPLANWVVNKDKDDKLNVVLGGYNLQHDKMQAIAFQYKAASASTWTTEKWWVNNPDLINKDAIEDTLFINDRSSVTYEWDMSSLSDREYEVRAISYCDNEVNSYSEVLAGMLDGKEPKLFGTPEPADGILGVGENIAIYFDEEIEAGLVNSSNVIVQGVLNGYETNHDVSVQLDGASSTVESAEGLQLANRSFTIEFWLKTADFATDGNIISYAYDGNNGLSLAMKDGKMQLTMNGITEDFACATNTTWHHYAISYDSQDERLRLVQDDGSVLAGNLLGVEAVSTLTENGVLTIGKDAVSSSFAGNIHDVRVWSKTVTPADVYSNMYTILNGKEMGLMSYWRMDEAFGELIQDKASARHFVMDGATWLVNPTGKSYAFNGNNALLANISTIPVTEDGDMTIELWFKAGADSKGSTFFSNGNPATAQAVNIPDILTMGIDAEGYVILNSNSETLLSTSKVADDKWHHLALVVKRTANAVLYLDGNLESSVYGSDFGAFGGSKLALGAMKANENEATSNYFTGQIDEVRIWHSARPLDIITAYRNARVSSKDLGLRAYFPFETYEKNIFDFYESTATVEDQSFSIYDNTSYCGTSALVGAANYSDVTPNIKRQRELSEVNCDITVNVDQIIIRPTDPDSKLENCMLEISVDGIYDKYENKMASAATWTAYVDRNTVTWTEDGVELAKDVNGEITFTSTIRNSGGTFESYSIENLPAWLTASPASGIIAPDDEEEITFTVNAGLNIGTFNEDLYLKTDFGFDEKMNIALRVKGDVPDWKVDYANNSESMSFIGRVKVEGQASFDEYDMVAVFAGEECRGVANIEYFLQIDEYLLMLTVYGETAGEDLTYSVYDASTGEVFTSCSVDSAFYAQMVYGSVANPVMFNWDNTIKNSISLERGWNWISFNSTMDKYAGLDDLMASVNPTSGDLIKSVTEGKVSQYFSTETASSWLGTVSIPQNDLMYQCYFKNGGQLIYEGVSISPKDYPITVASGWNRISYVPSINLEVNEALSAYSANAEDVIKSQLGFAIYTGFSWIGSLEFLEPGKGYMLKRASDDNTSFKYPSASTFVSSKASTVTNDDNFGLDPYQYATSASILARVSGVEDERAFLMAYIGEELRSVTPVTDELMFVTVYGNENEETLPLTFKVKTAAGMLDATGECQFTASAMIGSLDNPFLIETVVTGLTSIDAEIETLSVYPNPMVDVVNVKLHLDRAEIVSVEVYNTLGQRVFDTPQTQCQVGDNELQWNGAHLPNGIYTVVVNIGDDRRTVILNKVSQ